MLTFAVIDDKTVINVIIADSKSVAEELTNKECIEINEGFEAGIGWYLSDDFNKYIQPSPYNGWIYDGELWNPPVPYPVIEEGSDEKYIWDENTTSWLLLPPA
jgi:hypothetical protein